MARWEVVEGKPMHEKNVPLARSQVPYGNLSLESVHKNVPKGYRLDKPMRMLEGLCIGLA